MAFVLGLDAKLYYNSGTYAVPTWNVMNNVKDVTLNLSTEEADVTTRGGGGWKQTVATLKDGSIEWKSVWDTADAAFTAVKNAWLNKTPIEFLCLDGDRTVTGKQGLRAICMVTNFTREEPLTDALMVNVSVKPTYDSTNAPTWYVAP